jgi:hypothetical protein
MKYWYQFYND